MGSLSKTAISAAFSLILPLPSAAEVERVPVDATPANNSRIEFLSQEAKKAKSAAQDPERAESEVHAQASALFEEGLPQKDITRIGTLDLRGWEKPDFETRGGVDGIIHGMGKGIERGFKASQVPPPEDLQAAHTYAHKMRPMTSYGNLGNSVMGIYVYRRDSPIGIFFNNLMTLIQAYLGDQFAAATGVHEAAHAWDDARKNLNPEKVRNGEIVAYRTEYTYLIGMDPTGERLSWARATLGKFATGPGRAPRFVGEYLEHLAQIRHYGDRGDFAGLVAALGYRDEPAQGYAERLSGVEGSEADADHF